jgi:hypothetical protein
MKTKQILKNQGRYEKSNTVTEFPAAQCVWEGTDVWYSPIFVQRRSFVILLLLFFIRSHFVVKMVEVFFSLTIVCRIKSVGVKFGEGGDFIAGEPSPMRWPEKWLFASSFSKKALSLELCAFLCHNVFWSYRWKGVKFFGTMVCGP